MGEDGVLVAERGDGWEVILDDGPATRQNQLRAVDVIDDGERIWMVGPSGAMACYDVDQRRKYDYSSPEEMTSMWEAVAVCGDRDWEKVLAANGSSEVLPFIVDGFDVNWEPMSKPAGAGSNIAAGDGRIYRYDDSYHSWMSIGVTDTTSLRSIDIEE